MKKFTLMLTVLAMTITASAAVQYDYAVNSWMGFGTIDHFELRNGGTGWQVAEKSGAAVLESYNAWGVTQPASPITFSFEMTHNTATGDVTLTLTDGDVTGGSFSTVWETGNLLGWEEIQIMAKTSSANSSVQIANIDLDFGAITDGVTNQLNASGGNKLGMLMSGQTMAGFTLTGDVTFSDYTASDSDTEMFVGFANAVPEPATLALLGLGALFFRKTKRA